MNREEKAVLVEELAAEIGSAQAVYAVDYRGISVAQAADLRARLRVADATFRVVKNSLTERAADKAGAESLKDVLAGPTALTFVRGDAAVAAKALSDVGRATSVLEFKGGLLAGRVLTADDIRSISRLPAREVLHAQLVGAVASPLSGLVRTLSSLVAGLAGALDQIRERGLLGPAPEAAPEATAEPEAEVAPEAAAEPEAVAAPEATAESEAEAAPAPEPAPEPAAETPDQTETPAD